MNLILLAADELESDGTSHLASDDRRAVHLREVLHANSGDTVRVGVLGGGRGTAVVVGADAHGVTLHCTIGNAEPRPADVLILAIPRPKVLLRCIEAATTLGFGDIALVRTWRTDRSHVEASALMRDTLRARALVGLEQAERTHMPCISVFPRFRPFAEDHLDDLCGPAERVLADPGSTQRISGSPPPRGPIVVAIGPERGFTDFERALFAAHRFAAVRAGSHPLRVETALAFVWGQLTAARGGG